MYGNRARRCPSGAKDLGMQNNEKHTAWIVAPRVSTQPPAPLNQKISGTEKKGK